jgi:galactose oxidase
MVVVGGSNGNDFLTGTTGASTGGYNLPLHPDGGRRANSQTYSIDSPEIPGADWSSTLLPDPQFARIYANTVLMPDDKVFLVGGSFFDFLPYSGHLDQFQRNHERTAAPVFVPEILDCANPTGWVPVSAHVSPRLYHSVALLLPDARILVGGGYRGVKRGPLEPPPPALGYPENYTWENWENVHSNFEIYSPAYLSAGPRPEITGCPDVLAIGAEHAEIIIDRAGSADPVGTIGSVSLISPGSVTHHFDWDQRHVKLAFQPAATNPTHQLRVKLPANAFVTPPGYYMLFVTTTAAHGNGQRIPSVAKFVKLE